jgi:hypothetical protein
MKLPKYYPKKNDPLHEVRDWAKVRSMIRALRRGESLPPVYIYGPVGSGVWLSGTHRVAASEIRAKLDDLRPYEDLEIVDLGPVIESLSDEEREEWGSLEPEEAVQFLLERQTKPDPAPAAPEPTPTEAPKPRHRHRL